jgi:hypothetical protein
MTTLCDVLVSVKCLFFRRGREEAYSILAPVSSSAGGIAAVESALKELMREFVQSGQAALSVAPPAAEKHAKWADRALAHEHVCRQPVVSSAKGEKIDPVAAQMRSYLACLRSSPCFALRIRFSSCWSSRVGVGRVERRWRSDRDGALQLDGVELEEVVAALGVAPSYLPRKRQHLSRHLLVQVLGRVVRVYWESRSEQP